MGSTQGAPVILTFEQALTVVQQHASRLSQDRLSQDHLSQDHLSQDRLSQDRSFAIREVELLRSLRSVLAEDILADRDFPPFPRSTRDGYAVRSLDLHALDLHALDLHALPVRLRVVARIKAGGPSQEALHLESGQAAEIMTGAPVPMGADAVAMVEYAEESDGVVRIDRVVTAGENVVARGAEAKEGAILVARGTQISYPEIALAAAVGKSSLNVFQRPSIAILSTGDEVVPLDRTPAANEIRNSNSYSLAAQIELAGGDPIQLAIAPDERNRLAELISLGLESELLLLSGGVSMGKYDLVEDVLQEMNAEVFFTGALIQPGKPVVFGKVRSTYFLGLPGNPISTMVTFELFARPLIAALSGKPSFQHSFAQAVLKTDIKTKPGITRFLPAFLTADYTKAEVAALPWQGSGDIAALARCNCFLVVPPNREQLSSGEHVNVLMRSL